MKYIAACLCLSLLSMSAWMSMHQVAMESPSINQLEAELPIVVEAHPQEPPKQEITKVMEVMFVLDSTGSMSGLLAGAKERIWSIVNIMAKAADKPEIKIGIVAYRDRGDEYVTKSFPLTGDLDAMYASLMAIQANGGGDTPESVNQGLHEALTQTKWSESDNAYRVMFLVGDCPPHMDYENDVQYMKTCAAAVKKGIRVNTILCGNNVQALSIWKDIAKLGQGEFTQIQQSGGVQAIETPFDGEMVKLNQQMDKTRLYTVQGQIEQEKRQVFADAQYRESSVSSNAARSVFNSSKAGAGNFLGQNEIVNKVMNDEMDIAEIEEENLPTILRGKTQEQQQAIIQEKSQEREELRQKILNLQKKRSAWLSEHSEQSDDTFDVQVKSCIIRQIDAK